MNIRALMIAAFGSVLILAGCGAPTPSPAPIPNELQGCAMCEVPCPDYTGPVLAANYVAKHYPEQAAGLSPDRNAKDWIIKEAGSSVVVTNTVTGFRWEGNVVSVRRGRPRSPLVENPPQCRPGFFEDLSGNPQAGRG